MSQTSDIALGVGAGGLALGFVALVWVAVLSRKLRRLERAQTIVLGEHGEQDLVLHAGRMTATVQQMSDFLNATAQGFEQRMAHAEQRLDGSVSYTGLVRYDAYNEMSGRQSTSIALLDSRRTGIVLSSIHHRDQARMYAKGVREGVGELELSPEENEALRIAMGG
jgi:hypothetical protein